MINLQTIQESLLTRNGLETISDTCCWWKLPTPTAGAA